MDEATGAASLILFLALLAIEIIMYGFGRAIQSLNSGKIQEMAEAGNKKAEQIERIMDQPVDYINTIQTFTILIHLVMGGFFLAVFKRLFTRIPGMRGTIAVFLAGFVLLLILFVAGVLVPKKIATKYPKQWAFAFIRPIRALLVVWRPVTKLFDLLANLIVRLLGINPHALTADVTEEEILSMVNEGHEQGVLQESEAQMITNIFEFTDKDAKDIMTHRKNICALDGTRTFRQALEFIKENNYSRFPVFLDDIDNIIGVLHIKEALELSLDAAVYDTPVSKIKGLIREVDFIPETRNINSLFAMMQAAKSHLVIVVDEYGQTAGIVAMEDILEEIVGNIEDEHDEETNMVELQPDGSYLMSGMAPFDEVVEVLGIPLDEEDDFETLNGFLISLIDKIPSDDEVFSTTAYGYLFEILSVENKMIQKVHVIKLPEEKASEVELADGTCQNEE